MPLTPILRWPYRIGTRDENAPPDGGNCFGDRAGPRRPQAFILPFPGTAPTPAGSSATNPTPWRCRHFLRRRLRAAWSVSSTIT